MAVPAFLRKNSQEGWGRNQQSGSQAEILSLVTTQHLLEQLKPGLLGTKPPASSPEQAFVCIRCGLCCQQLNMNPLYAALDRGDGVCMHYDNSTRQCGIYEQRPLICRVDDSYVYFSPVMSREQYHVANSLVCSQLIARFEADKPTFTCSAKP